MTRRAAIPQREYDNALKAALKNLPVGTFKIAVENGHAAILPASANDPADDLDDELRTWRASNGDG